MPVREQTKTDHSSLKALGGGFKNIHACARENETPQGGPCSMEDLEEKHANLDGVGYEYQMCP